MVIDEKLLILASLLFSGFYVTGSVIGYRNFLKCESYDEKVCSDPPNNCTSTFSDDLEEEFYDDGKIEECNQDEFPACFVLWSNDSRSHITVKKKGCFYDIRCQNQTRCIGRKSIPSANLHFCCCDENNCNTEFIYEPSFIEEEYYDVEGADENASESYVTFVCSFLIISCLGLLLAAICVFRKHKFVHINRNPQFDQRSQTDSSSVSEKLLPIDLIEVKAKGRFGEVWKALNKNTNEYVAVKIVPAQDKQSWITEQEVFKLPNMDHKNILQFFGAEKHDESPHPNYWLITAYHERGSLCDYLKSNTVTWEELCLISYTMARGLSHLHDEIRSELPECYKPMIAHRDFKSSNVLLKNDLTACIADFGLAIIFKNSQFYDSNHGQVGTRRYMAPEVLEGSISFSTVSFQRIDIYACGLVLWEILSRCTVHEDAALNYKLPFEEELGEHPSIEEMLELVVYNRGRPIIKDSWKRHPLLSSICETIEECWDADTDARLTAPYVTERFYWNLRSCANFQNGFISN